MRLPELVEGRLLRRRNRFVAEVQLPTGVVEAHCPNTGSMLGCRAPGSRVWLSSAGNPKRKLAWTWELVEADGVLVGIHTGRSNALVREAIENGVVPELAGYDRIRAEVPYGANSRIDLLLEGSNERPPCYIEVKNVTAGAADGIGWFPDAVTTRGTKHLREMMAVVAGGGRAMLCFCVQRGDVAQVRPADHIDPVYGRTLRDALAAGVEVHALRARVAVDELVLEARIAVATD